MKPIVIHFQTEAEAEAATAWLKAKGLMHYEYPFENGAEEVEAAEAVMEALRDPRPGTPWKEAKKGHLEYAQKKLAKKEAQDAAQGAR